MLEVSRSVIEKAQCLAYNGKKTVPEIIDEFSLQDKSEIIWGIQRAYKLGVENRLEAKIRDKESIGLPETRLNFYIYGTGCPGNTSFSDALAYFFYPKLKEDDRIYNFTSLSCFYHYKGQPVIIWDDHKGKEILNDIKTPMTFFSCLPGVETPDIRVRNRLLINKYNIVNSTESFDTFITNLSKKEYKEKYFRRFPIYIEVKYDSVNFFVDDRVYDYNVDYGKHYSHVFSLDINVGRFRHILSTEEFFIIIEILLEKNGFRKILENIERSIKRGVESKEEAEAAMIECNIDPKKVYERMRERNLI